VSASYADGGVRGVVVRGHYPSVAEDSDTSPSEWGGV
jgi:hypothetical protein